MKQIIAIISVFMLLTSCKKSDSTSQPTASTFKFTANGIVYQFDGYSPDINNIKGSHIIYTSGINAGYFLGASEGSAASSIYLQLTSNTTLTATNYSITHVAGTDELSEMEINAKTYYTSSSGDFTNVSITKIEGGYASGTFTAKMTQQGTATRIDITNGEFSKVKIEN